MVALISFIASCFKGPSQIDTDEGASGTLPSCKFCHVSKENGFNIIYEDESFIAFRDRKPASEHHYLVIPRKHIESVRTLKTPSDAELVRQMDGIAQSIFNTLGVPEHMRKTGFHIPPFNSVYHLHLHVQGLPYLSQNRAAQYPVASGSNGNSKGFSWFVEARQAIQILERGRRVGLLPC